MCISCGIVKRNQEGGAKGIDNKERTILQSPRLYRVESIRESIRKLVEVIADNLDQ